LKNKLKEKYKNFLIRAGLTVVALFFILIILGFLLIYAAFYFDNLILFIIGVFSIVGAFIALFSVSVVEVFIKKEKYFDVSLIIGKEGKALMNIKKNEKGNVYVEGEEWLAYALEDIFQGDKIIVEKIEGNILYVKKVK